LHPGHAYARTWERLRERLGEHAACRTYVRLLHLAHRHVCEAALGARLEALLASDDLPNAEALRAEFAAPAPSTVPILHFHTADPAGYDVLRGLSASLLSSPVSPPQAASA
jgi:hypothetical protein